jgi:hypothetical protein
MENVVGVFALRHLGVEREFLVIKAGRNFYLFPPYAKKTIGSVDVHISWHESGERHFVARLNGRQGTGTRPESIVKLCPPSELKGVVELYHSGNMNRDDFINSFPVGTNQGQVVLLDSTAAGFRDDDFIVIRVYGVSPGAEKQIPTFPDTGPRILYFVKQTTPWLAVEVYQERMESPVREDLVGGWPGCQMGR